MMQGKRQQNKQTHSFLPLMTFSQLSPISPFFSRPWPASAWSSTARTSWTTWRWPSSSKARMGMSGSPQKAQTSQKHPPNPRRSTRAPTVLRPRLRRDAATKASRRRADGHALMSSTGLTRRRWQTRHGGRKVWERTGKEEIGESSVCCNMM